MCTKMVGKNRIAIAQAESSNQTLGKDVQITAEQILPKQKEQQRSLLTWNPFKERRLDLPVLEGMDITNKPLILQYSGRSVDPR